ncbi:aminotransferase class I/II-fold pyridoxal phosphate-dependent enzyme [Streptomyces sp. RB6PN25]|uniref:Aminotransferase class I/II-fold pyridoxal phosphate-dependent enzyme n=2 Tax=Streptomyces humicola TaxID=2953240 RepID=A0ABT1PRS8_9ACTN|nr:aminotransferase class I/II-fold pyridoxal phosphate-dependent enzyme [Streptomyces humicola]
MGCRFPGARSVPAYWRMLRRATPQFRAVPPERWDHSLIHTPQDRRARAGTYTDRLATVDGADLFDARHYRMSPRRVQAMDPQHRLLLDASREALQDAGWERRAFDHDSTGVFFGLNVSEYLELLPDVLTAPAATMPGVLHNMAATNVSRFFDLHGPSFTVDAACSASLVALHQALAHLGSGECRVALVGGAYLALDPRTLLGFSKVGAVSPSGVCRPFDRDADGFVLGDGVGVVVLRSLEEALSDGDRVYAVIRGIGTSNDGTAEGPMTPSVEGQLMALRRAYADAGVAPLSIGFLEAHGTATAVGDSVELQALARLRSETMHGAPPHDTAGRACLSSAKALMGHSLGASGIASLIKTALVLHHRTIVPMPATTPADRGLLEAAGLRIPRSEEPWRRSGTQPLRASVSNFGFGGTNVHIIVEESPQPQAAVRTGKRGNSPAEAQLFLFSAGSLLQLEAYLVRFLETLQDSPAMPLPAIARTLAVRQLLPARLALVAGDHAELRNRVQQARSALAQGRVGPLGEGMHAAAEPLPAAERRTAFLFPGQGTQRPGMARDLYARFPAVRTCLEGLNAVAVDHEGGFSLLDAVYGPGGSTPAGRERLTRTDVCQPVVGAFSMAVSRFLRALGAEPDVCFGHSMGEFTAAAAAGALDDADCLRLLLARGAVMRRAESPGRGGMLAVRGGHDEITPLAENLDEVWAACWNHPKETVYSGTAPALAELARRCADAGLPVTALQVSNGFHSPLIDTVLDDLVADAASRHVTRPAGAFVSSVSGAVEDDPDVLRGLWGRHACAPVRFADASQAAYDAGARLFVQVCGGRGLLGAVRQSLADPGAARYVALTGDGPDEARTFLTALGELAVAGVELDATKLVPEGAALVTLEASPLVPSSHWYPRVASRVPPPPTVPALGAADNAAAVAHTRPQAQQQTASVPGPHGEHQVNGVSVQRPHLPRCHDHEQVRARVYTEVSAVSAFRTDQLTDDLLIVEHLGFDSLMVSELAERLRRAFPEAATQLKEGFLLQRPTIAQVVEATARLLGLGPAAHAGERRIVAPPAAAPLATVPAERRIEDFPELLDLEQRISASRHNPYFLLHEGMLRDTTVVGGRQLISFSGYNYLGLSGHPAVTSAVKEAVDRYGTSVSASRFLSGDRPLHRELEAELAALTGSEAALALVSGHATNVTVIGHLTGPGDLILHDALAHDSILQGCTLSGARRRSFPHNDMAALDRLLHSIRGQFRRVLIVVEGVYSMDGDIVDLPALTEVKERHGAIVMVDEAHSIGVLGSTGGGVGEHFGVERATVDLWSGTLSKSLAGCGGFVAGTRRVIEYLKYSVPGFVYSVGMTPANAAASLAAIRVMREEPERLKRLRVNSDLFLSLAREAGIDTGGSDGTPVIPAIVKDSEKAVRLAAALFDSGVSVNPILYPAVAEDLVRLRFFVTSEHTQRHIEHSVASLAEQWRLIRSKPIRTGAR